MARYRYHHPNPMGEATKFALIIGAGLAAGAGLVLALSTFSMAQAATVDPATNFIHGDVYELEIAASDPTLTNAAVANALTKAGWSFTAPPVSSGQSTTPAGTATIWKVIATRSGPTLSLGTAQNPNLSVLQVGPTLLIAHAFGSGLSLDL